MADHVAEVDDYDDERVDAIFDAPSYFAPVANGCAAPVVRSQARFTLSAQHSQEHAKGVRHLTGVGYDPDGRWLS